MMIEISLEQAMHNAYQALLDHGHDPDDTLLIELSSAIDQVKTYHKSFRKITAVIDDLNDMYVTSQ